MFAVTQTSTLYLPRLSIGRENTVYTYKTGIKRRFPEMNCSTMYFSKCSIALLFVLFSCKTVSQYCILINSGACVCLCLATRHFNTVNESLKVTSLYIDLYKTDTSLIQTLCSYPFGCIREVQLYSFSFFFFYFFYFILFICLFIFFWGGGG